MVVSNTEDTASVHVSVIFTRAEGATMSDHATTVRASLPGSRRPGPGNGWSALERERASYVRVELRFTRRTRDLCERLRASSPEGKRV
jgi:hypothetical protein